MKDGKKMSKISLASKSKDTSRKYYTEDKKRHEFSLKIVQRENRSVKRAGQTLYTTFMKSIIAEIPILNRVASISSVTYKKPITS